MNSKITSRKSFTLIEMVIVIAILAILAVLAISKLSTSIIRARDTTRKSDLANMQRAFELFYSDNNRYPNTGEIPAPGNCWSSGGGSASCPADKTIYMVKVPGDPKTGANYLYCSQGSAYQIYACLENTNDTNRISPNILCPFNCPGGASAVYFGLSSSNSKP